jgi:AMP phosphorylase
MKRGVKMEEEKGIVKIKVFDLETDEKIVLIRRDDAEKLDLKSQDKIILQSKEGKRVYATIYISNVVEEKNLVLVSNNLAAEIDIKDGDKVKISLAPIPKSIQYIKKKISGQKLDANEIYQIIRDIVDGHIGPVEIMGYTLAVNYVEMDMDEIEALTRAMYETGNIIEFDAPTYDKHSIGGVPGNKVSLLIVPIVAAAGLLIPKTSSKAITSPTGTADTMEVLADVEFDVDEFKEIVSKTGGAIVWGGKLELAPADDIIIRAERTLGLDPIPQMIASIMAKKMATGIKHLVLDIPAGVGTKMTTVEEATNIGRLFIELGDRLGVRVQCGVTYGAQPVGHAVGPALEAREALQALIKDGPASLIEKATSLAGILLEMGGKAPIGYGYALAKEILRKGDAYSKMKEIIEAQGGDPDVKPDEIPVGEYHYEVYAPVDGFVTDVSNIAVSAIARAAGAPKDRGAGIILHVKRGHKVTKGDKILDIYAERSTRLQDAVGVLHSTRPIIIEGMLLKTIPERPIYTYFSQGSSSE